MEEGSFVKIDYTAKLGDGTVFDTTRQEEAQQAGITRPVSSVVVCLGQQQLLPGLDKALVGKEKGEHKITLKPEEAFGKKDSKKFELVPMAQLKKQGINPQPGMQIEIDNQYGLIKNVSGGRVIVDFNHPFADQEITYELTVHEEVTGLQEQVQALLDTAHIPFVGIEADGTHVIIKTPQLYPQPIMDALQKKVTELTKAEQVSFEQGTKK